MMKKKVDYSDPKQRNPQNDPDVQSGWERAQERLKEKKDAEDCKERGEIEKPYEVDSGGIDDANVPYKE